MSSPGLAEEARPRDSPLFPAKLSPPTARTPVIRRPRLLQLVSHGVEGPLTVVTGPPGAGKGLLLASWAGNGGAPGPVAWLNLDASDDQPGVFWTYALAALRRAGVDFPEDVGQPMRPDDVDRSFLARVAAAVATAGRPVVLVLDGFDVITDPEVTSGLEFVLRNAAPRLRLVILSRDDQPLPLHRYELAGEVTRIDGAALAFTPEEAETLLRQHGVQLSPAALAQLLEHVGGWAAGLRLSALAMQRHADPEKFVRTLPAADATLSGFLVDEVLGAQTEEVRSFLLKTSIVDSVCPDLADALTGEGDGRVVLPALHTGNVLTERLDAPGEWYRYHPMFRTLLRAELERRCPGASEQLSRRAADWYERAGMTVEAACAAARCGDWQAAAAAVVRGLAVGALLTGQEATTLGTAMRDLPDKEPGAMPALVRAARAMASFDLLTCREQVRLAGEQPVDADAEPQIRASGAVLRAVLARAEGDVDEAEAALAEGERRLARIPKLAARHPEVRALLLSNVGTAQMWAGRFAAAEETLRRGLAVSRVSGCEYPRQNILGRLAGVEFRNGRLRRAARLGQEALFLAEECGLPVELRTGIGHLTLAMVAVEWYDRAAARRHLDDAERTIGARHDPFVAVVVPLLRAWLHAGARDQRRAFAVLATVPTIVAGRPLPAWIASRVALTEAFLHLGQGNPDKAAAALERADERGPEWAVMAASVALARHDGHRARALLDDLLTGDRLDVDASRLGAWLVLARLAVEERNPAAARDALAHALTLGRPEGYRRAFVQAGPWLRELLKANSDLAAVHRWLGPALIDSSLVADSPGPLDDPPMAVVERLTERELTVLQRLAQGLSAADVAQELFLSINTVKTHQKSLYRKLGVARRNEAVRKARQLHLI